MAQSTGTDYDIIISGFGPVGQIAANLLGQAGHRVLALEQWGGIYNLPRACHTDHEIMRIFQSIHVHTGLQPTMLGGSMKAEFLSGGGHTLIKVATPPIGKSGWGSTWLFHQPELEKQLSEASAAYPSVEVRYNARIIDISQNPERVAVTIENPETRAISSATGQYLIGCDGANGLVRPALGLEYDDLGFDEEWMVLDMILHDRTDIRLPDGAQQICDPKRPITIVPMPEPRLRMEFRKMPGDTREKLESEDFLWENLKRWGMRPDNSEIERASVYTFMSKVAGDWQKGRAFLAGDACHLTPPFLGQGASMGFRDAKNLCWKLDLVLRGLADERILDAYGPERQPQVRKCVELALDQGAIICQTNPIKAGLRDLGLRALHALGKTPNITNFPDLLEGILHNGPDGRRKAPAGDLFIQGRVDGHSKTDVLLDDLIAPDGLGSRFVLIGCGFDPLENLTRDLANFWEEIGGLSVHLGGPIIETTGNSTYADWFAAHSAAAVLMRPDFYTFGTADTPEHIPALITDLRDQLRPAVV